MMKLKINNYLLILIASLIIAFSLNSISLTANADTNGGSGDTATNGKVAKWVHAYGNPWKSGESPAFKKFKKTVLSTSSYFTSEAKLKSEINKLDHVSSGNSDLSLYESCKRSQFIWWYGKPFYTKIGVNAHPKLSQLPAVNTGAKNVIKAFSKIPNNGWGKSGGTVIICSYSLEEDVIKRPLTFKADSKSFKWDGTKKEVRTYKLIKGKLRSGHDYRSNTSAYGSGINPGRYNVSFNNVKIVDKKTGKNVTSQYKIKTISGKLTIHKKPVTEKERFEYCEATTKDKVFTTVRNDIAVSQGFFPNINSDMEDVDEDSESELYEFDPILEERYNKAWDLLDNSPDEGARKSKWNAFKANFENTGNNDKDTEKISFLDDIGLDDSFSQYGGVYNVLRTHYKYKIEVEFCQPLIKEVTTTTTTDANGKEHTTEKVTFKKDGEEVIDKRKDTDGTAGEGGNDPDVKPEFYYYQILGVNCNEEEFNKIYNLVGGKKFNSVDPRLNNLLQTPVKKAKDSNISWPLQSTAAYTDSFYKDGKSCKEVFKNACTADTLVGAMNDADNNNGKPAHFTHVDKELYSDGHGETKDGILNIFRDNKSREIRADVWYPSLSVNGVKTFPGTPAENTFVKIIQGTPEIDITTIKAYGAADEDKIEAIGSEELWDGSVNRFDIKSQWASQEGKQYDTKVEWKYKSEVSNGVVNVFDGKGVINVADGYTYEIDTVCAFDNGTGRTPGKIPDNPYFNYDEPVGPDWNGGTISTEFTRAVSDKSQ